MLERFDSIERGPQRSSLLALGLAAVTLFAACGDEGSPASPGKNEDPSTNSDSDDDHTTAKTDASVKKDASKPLVDAGADDKSDDGDKDGGSAAVGNGNLGTAWCKAKQVLDTYCVSCHDGQGSGGSPMGLTSIEDLQADAVVSQGKKVYEVVGTRIHDTKNPMPPKQKLSAEELATLDAFVAAKAPAGDNPSCTGSTAPTGGDAGTTAITPDWNPDSCDAIYKIYAHATSSLDTPLSVPAGQEIHPQIYWDAPWGSEKVQMINVRPITDNKKVLHHWILYSGQGAFLTGWAPGDNARKEFPSDIGMNMPTGARSLRLDMHYFNTMGTQTELDESGLEICIVKGAHLRPKAAAVTMSFVSLGNFGVLAPAGANNTPTSGTCNVQATSPVTLMTASPHAHTYANHMKFTVKKKSGETIVMHDGDFKFGEQQSYALDPPVVLETGDVVTTTCYYTNPTTKNITFGESTTNEMCFNFASYWPAGALSCSGFGGIPAGFLN
jgi:cytochrome c5